jgi:hypothetical protein
VLTATHAVPTQGELTNAATLGKFDIVIFVRAFLRGRADARRTVINQPSIVGVLEVSNEASSIVVQILPLRLP